MYANWESSGLKRMAFSRRAKEVKKQSPDNNHTSDFRDLQDGQPDLALRRTAQSVRSLTNGIRGLAKKASFKLELLYCLLAIHISNIWLLRGWHTG